MSSPPPLFGFDAFSPAEIARKVGDLGVAKARLPAATMLVLGVLAGAYIAMGAMLNVIVLSDPSVPMGLRRVLGGAAFSLGLFLVIVGGAELFTGNNLLAMAWAERRVTTTEMLSNWAVVLSANAVGAIGLAWLVLLSGHPGNDGGAVARTYLSVASHKTSLPWVTAFFSGVMCNVLVCTAIWMALAGRSVVDKAVAVLLPITLFVAAGFEHSVANLYLIPLAMMLQAQAGQAADFAGLAGNLVPVIAGNIVGGSVLVALVYHVVYVRPRADAGRPPAEQGDKT
jgi:formate/nitrite transporter